MIFSKLFSKSSVEQKPRGVVLVRPGLTQGSNLGNRLSAIREAFELAGIDQTICILPRYGGEWMRGTVPDGMKILEERHLSRLSDGPFVLTNDLQFALAPEVVRQMLDRVAKTSRIVCLDDTASLLRHTRLYGWCIAGPGDALNLVCTILRDLFFEVGNASSRLLETEECESFVVDRSAMQAIYRRTVGRILPVTITLESTNRCNQGCVFCPYHGERQKGGWRYIRTEDEVDMELETFERLLDEVASWREEYLDDVVRTVVPYMRGELLLYERYKDVCSLVKKHGQRLFFVSNATLMTEDAARFLIEIGTDLVKISRHGLSDEAIAGVKVEEFANQAERNILRLLELREEAGTTQPEIGVTCTLNESTVGEVDDFLEFWKSKVDFVDFSPENYHCEVTRNKKYRDEFTFFEVDPALRPPCMMLLDSAWVLADCSVMPCIGGIREKLGNCRDAGVLDTMRNSSLLQDLLAMHGRGEYDVDDRCNECQVYKSSFLRSQKVGDVVRNLSPVMSHNRLAVPSKDSLQ